MGTGCMLLVVSKNEGWIHPSVRLEALSLSEWEKGISSMHIVSGIIISTFWVAYLGKYMCAYFWRDGASSSVRSAKIVIWCLWWTILHDKGRQRLAYAHRKETVSPSSHLRIFISSYSLWVTMIDGPFSAVFRFSFPYLKYGCKVLIHFSHYTPLASLTPGMLSNLTCLCPCRILCSIVLKSYFLWTSWACFRNSVLA